MKLTVEQVTTETPEEVLIRCHDPEEPWVSEVQNIAAGQITVNGVLDGKMCRLKLGDIYYFEVVEGSSFLYCQKEVFSCKQKLYEFEALCIGTMLFRCSKSMILNAGKIDSITKKTNKQYKGSKIVLFSTPKLVQHIYNEKISISENEMANILSQGVSGKIVVMGTTSYDLEIDRTISMTSKELTRKIMEPNGINIVF